MVNIYFDIVVIWTLKAFLAEHEVSPGRVFFKKQ